MGCNAGRAARVPHNGMSGRWLLLLALGAWLEAGELLTYDAAGALRGSWPALAAQPGHVIAPREALLAAARAAYLDEQFRLHPVLWLSGDDPDAGLAELFVGYQLRAGGPRALEIGASVSSSGRTARPLRQGVRQLRLDRAARVQRGWTDRWRPAV